ncbi:MAG: helix-turn-helix transcriptional regulator [Phaeodactylibacter sp.]|uniref:helix-turn-helix transcriptional regulator n=1 Tax=Phaeodactylibacter sp. TaxID=1940289 RepID=UPI0032EF9769
MAPPSAMISNNRHSPAQREWLTKVDRIIASNLADSSFTVGLIASKLYVSERQFYRKLKQLTSRTPNRYIQNARMVKAHKMIKAGYTGDLSKLAKSVGYQRADYFSTVYQQYYGVRPNEAINRNK